ncbi:MAG: hypothetical protein SFY70_03550 [Bacteroidia bacterium]|nr:hypothetical protein [Bacteroidia bacterium]
MKRVHLAVRCAWLLAGSSLLLTPAWAQRLEETRNVVSPRVPTEWYKLDSPNFQIQFYQQNRALAELAARYAEDAYYNFRRTLEYRTETRYQILVYSSPVDYVNAQYNQYEESDLSYNLNRISVYFNGSQQDFYREIRTKLIAAILDELFFGGSTAQSVQSKLLLQVPRWYGDGLTLFLGEGWLPGDEAYMRSLDKEKGSFAERVLIEDRIDQEPILRKSIWYFVRVTYGLPKLVELVYMTRLTRSVQVAVNRVLGLSMQSFTLKWVDFVKTEFQADRQSLERQTVLDFKPPAGARIVGIDAAPDGNSVAYYQEKNGIYELKIYNFETGAVVNTPVAFGKYSDFDAYRGINFPTVWSPDGNSLATTVIENGFLKLVFYDRTTRKVEKFDLTGQIDWVSSMAWGKAKRLLLLSGVRNGVSDLYLNRPASTSLQQVTRTPYDELNPAWSPDGERIFFASNAGDSVYTDEKAINYQQSLSSYDLYYLPFAYQGQKPTRITFSPYGNERNLKLIGTTLFYVSDENGLENLASLNLAANNLEVSYLSNYGTGVTDFGGANSGRFIVRSVTDGRPRFFLVQQGDLVPIPFILRTRQASVDYQGYLKGLLEKAKDLEVITNEEVPQPVTDSLVGDTAKPAPTPKPRPRYYVFDETADPEKPTGTPTEVGVRREPLLKVVPVRTQPFDINKVRTGGLGRSGFGFDLRLIESLSFELDPILRENFTAEAEVTDNRLYHRLRAGVRLFLDFTSNDYWVDYQWLRYRVQLEAGIRKEAARLDYVGVVNPFTLAITEYRFLDFIDQNSPEAFSASGYLDRLVTYEGYLGAAYPINRFQRVNLRGKFLVAQRIDQLPAGSYPDLSGFFLFAFDSDRNTNAIERFYGLQAQYTFDNTLYVQDYPLRGIFGQVTAETYFTSGNTGPVYPEIKAQFRSYTPLVKDVVVALSGQIGTSPVDTRRRNFAIGGVDNWVARKGADISFDNSPAGYHFLNFLGGVRGVPYGVRTGRNFALFSGELRLPIRRLFNIGLNTRYLHNIVVVGFVDAGTAWNEGNPLSKQLLFRQRTVAQGEFLITVNEYKAPVVYSFGGGIRTPFLGYEAKLDIAAAFDDGERLPLQFVVSIGKLF